MDKKKWIVCVQWETVWLDWNEKITVNYTIKLIKTRSPKKEKRKKTEKFSNSNPFHWRCGNVIVQNGFKIPKQQHIFRALKWHNIICDPFLAIDFFLYSFIHWCLVTTVRGVYAAHVWNRMKHFWINCASFIHYQFSCQSWLNALKAWNQKWQTLSIIEINNFVEK